MSTKSDTGRAKRQASAWSRLSEGPVKNPFLGDPTDPENPFGSQDDSQEEKLAANSLPRPPSVPTLPAGTPIPSTGQVPAVPKQRGEPVVPVFELQASGSSDQRAETAKLNLKAQELACREAEICKREQALAATEADLERGKRKNWPPCKPVVHHDIQAEVLEGPRRLLMMRAYALWLICAAAFFWNWLAITMMVIGSHKCLTDWLFACLICGFGLPLSFVLWYWPLYRAAARDRLGKWVRFFIFFPVQLALAAWVAVGPPVVGNWSAGGFTAVHELKLDTGAGVFFGLCCILNMFLWAAALLLGAWVLLRAYQTFRGHAF